MVKSFADLVNEVRAGGVEELTVKQLAALRKAGAPMVLLDIREPHEQVKGAKIKGAVCIPRGLLEMNIDRHIRHPNELLILVCSDGMRSIMAAESLKRMGFTNAKVLAGGFRALQAAAKPSGAEAQPRARR